MNASNPSKQKVIQDVFDKLFHECKDMQTRPLPRFRKRKKREQLTREGSLSADSLQASTSLPNLRECSADNSQWHRAMSHQGSFSSGVYSLDSDCECPPTENNSGQVKEFQRQSLSRLEPGECDMSGPEDTNQFVTKRLKLGGISCSDRTEDQSKHKLQSGASCSSGDNGDCKSDDAPSEAGSGFTDRHGNEMCLPKDEGQMQVCLRENSSADEASGGKEMTKNGILTDKDVLFMMHKPRIKEKKKKKPPWQKRKLDLDDLWLKGQHRWSVPREDASASVNKRLFLDRNLQQGKIHLKKYICMMTKTRTRRQQQMENKRGLFPGRTKKISKTSKQECTSSTLSFSSSTSQDERKQKTGKLYRRSVKNNLDISSSVKKQKSPAGLEKSSTSTGTSSGKKGSSRDKKATISHSRDKRKVQTDVDNKKKQEQDLSNSSESEDSLINFISLTPKKSRPKRKPRKQTSLVSMAKLPTQRASCLGTNRRRDSLLRCEGILSPVEDDSGDLLPSYQPLFGHTRHCGGIWNSIVEESS